MILIGLDVATLTGIAVLKVADDKKELVEVLMIDTRELYFKHNVYEQTRAIKELVADVCELINVSDKVVIALERSNYSKHCASIFGEICGMLMFEFITQLATPPLITQFSPDEWHKKIYTGRLERKEWKQLSIKKASEIIGYNILSDDIADAVNIAWHCDECRNNVKIHEDVVERKQTKRNVEHELVKLYQKRDYWNNKLKFLEGEYDVDWKHQKSIGTKIRKVKDKLSIINLNIFDLMKQKEEVK